MEREAALVVDDVVPHAQAALLRLTEVVGVQDASDVLVQVDRDDPVVGVATGLQAGRVDDLHLRLFAVIAIEVEFLLHPRDVGVALLHEQAGGRAHVGVVADEAVDLDHVVLGDVGVLQRRDLIV